jgi:hypothetical protein
MDHEAYEKEMIDRVNRNAEEKSKPAKAKQKVFTKADGYKLKRGLVATILALFTTSVFALAVCGFISVAFMSGYLAVLLFITSIMEAVCGFILLYALGILTGSAGEGK